MAPRDTYNSSVASAEVNRDVVGATGQGNGTLIPNNTQQYPSKAAIEAAFAFGYITQAQRVALKHAANMNAEVQIQAARDVLRNSGDYGPT